MQQRPVVSVCQVAIGPGTERVPQVRVDTEDLVALLALRHAAGSRSVALALALRQHPEPRALAATATWRPRAVDWHEGRRQHAAIAAMQLAVVPPWALPESLARLGWLPTVLFVRGDALLLERVGVAIVGARRAGASAVGWAVDRAREAAEAGHLIVSGGARGVDAAAHRGALRAGAASVAYLGVAADRTYPAANRELFARILASGGALVSEHPPGPATVKAYHAHRNRFIAAQAGTVLIAEAGVTSGALGTARYARELGIPIWVSPPDIGGERGGLDELVASGVARVWRGWESIVDDPAGA